MKILFNEIPQIRYDIEVSEHQNSFEEGYATPISDKDNVSVLVFKDVEDHIDGNGLAIFWMIQGEGDFYYNEKRVSLSVGDVIVFDDNIEHGFSSDVPCIAVNININDYPNWNIDLIKEKISLINNPIKKLKP